MSDSNPYETRSPYASPKTDLGFSARPKKKRLTRIAPLQAGIVSGVLYALISLIAVPILLFFPLAAGVGGAELGFVIMIPIIYGILGFIGGVIGAAVYNLVAGWTGGLAFETTEN